MDLISPISPPIYLVYSLQKYDRLKRILHGGEEGGGVQPQSTQRIHINLVFQGDKGNIKRNFYVNGKFQRKYNGNVDLA